ncbi:MAG: TIR domain-containing protein [Terracidiphilus sp.]|jgi:WD40 repeat protein
MAQIFISHSSLDQKQAAELLAWLREQGFSSTFLDFDKHKGIAPGANWEQTLYRELSGSVAVILILTKNWFHSKWCFVEFAQARALGKAIFPLVEAATGERFVSPDIQHLDLVKDREGGLDRLRSALTQILMDSPEGFAWDSTRPPYPGLLAFNEGDAAIYFGRDDSIRQLIERLNARRAMGGEKLLVVLGASGAGKSSLLRAGVLPRLKRDPHNWIVLPPFRPQLQPLSELAHAVAKGLGDDMNWRRWLAALENPDLPCTLADLARDLRAAHRENEAHILVTIDQGEELFGGADASQVERFLAVLNAMLDERLPFLAVMSLRSDYLGELQKEARLTATFEQFSLKPMPLERVREIIRGPARVAGITVDEALITAVIADARTEDALPLLAFVLRELYDKYGGARHFTEQSYRALGSEGLSPLENAVRRKADEVISAHNPSAEEMQSLKEAFIPAMVRVNAEGEYVRRSAAMADLPARALPLIQKLANARLLTISKDATGTRVEVAHEALLRNWPRLRNWLDEEQEFLIGKDQLEQDLRDWERVAPDQRMDALLTGLKLTRAREWLAAKPLQLSQAEHRFIQESQAHHDAEAARRQRTRRRVLQAAVAAAIVLAVVAGIAIQQRLNAKDLRLTASWNFLSLEALRQMSQEGDDDLALLLTRQADRIQKRLPNQPARLIDYNIYSMLPSGAFRHVLHGHDAAVMAVAFSPDKKTLASGSWDRTVRIWDLRQPQVPPRILGMVDAGIWTLAFSSDGQRLAAGSDNGTVYLWDMNRQQVAPIVLKGQTFAVHSLAFSPNGRLLAAGSANSEVRAERDVRVWNLDNPQARAQVLSGGHGSGWSVAFDPGGSKLVAGGDEGAVEVWDLGYPEKPAMLPNAQSNGASPVTPSGSDDRSDHSDQRPCDSTGYYCPSKAVMAVAWSGDGLAIAAGSGDATIAVWNLQQSGKALKVATAKKGAVLSVAFSRDGKQLASGGVDATLRIWNLKDLLEGKGPKVVGLGHKGIIRSVAFSPDGNQVATGSEDTTVRIWDQSVSLPSTATLDGQAGAINAVAFSTDSKRLASASDKGAIRIWDMSKLGSSQELKRYSGAVWSVGFSPDGKRLVSGGSDRTVRVWDLNNPSADPRVLGSHLATVWSVAFSPDGHTVASGSADGTARIWDLRQVNPRPLVLGQVQPLPTQEQPCSYAQIGKTTPHDIYSVAFAPDGQELATGGADAEVSLWKLNNLSAHPSLKGHTDWVCAVKFSPDGTTLASGSGDNSIRIWNLRQAAALPAVLEGHSYNVVALDFSRDGTRRLASSSIDQTIRVWDMYAPGSDSQVFPVAGGNIARSVAFSPDGQWLAYGDTDGTIRLLRQPESLTKAVCNVVWRDLTMDEWLRFVGKGIPYEPCPNKLPPREGAPEGAP